MAKRGRPKKTLSDLPSDWREKMLELAATGASDVELRIDALGHISDDLWYRLIDEEPEFSRTVKKAHDLCEAWWVKAGRAGSVGKINLNTGSWIFNMKNRFSWRDKHDYEHSGPGGKDLNPPKIVVITGAAAESEKE